MHPATRDDSDFLEAEADVVVVGAGSAGVAAAVSAAESGAEVLLVEASGEVGGTLAWQLLEHSAGFHDSNGKQVVGGFGQRVVDRLQRHGSSPGHIRDDVGYTATRTPFNHAELALVEASLLQEARVRLLLHSPVVSAELNQDRITSVVVASPEGSRRIRAATFIDTSGDAALAHLASAPMQNDVPDRVQPASLLLKLGGVDFETFLQYAASHPEELREGSIVGAPTDEHVNLWGFGALLETGHAEGLLSLRRSEMHIAGWPRRRELILNVTRAPWSGTGAQEEGAVYFALATQVLEVVNWFRHSVPGGADAYLAAIADRIGVRESRRVLGLNTLSQQDVVHGRRHADTIASAAFPIDIHDSLSSGLSHSDMLNSSYDIPYGCLVADHVANLLVAGRCLSSTHEANGSARITATCFATGEAAGVAAALAVQCGCSVACVPISRLQELLTARGVLGLEQTEQEIEVPEHV